MNEAEKKALRELITKTKYIATYGELSDDAQPVWLVDEPYLIDLLSDAIDEAYERGRKDGYKQGNKDGHFAAWGNAIDYQRENLTELFDLIIEQTEKLKEDIASQEPGAYDELKDSDIPESPIPDIKRKALVAKGEPHA